MLRIEFQTRPDGVLRQLHEDGGSLTVDSVLQVEQERWLITVTANGYAESPWAHFGNVPETELLHFQPLTDGYDTYRVLAAVEASGSFIVQTLVRNQAVPHTIQLDSHLLEGVVTVDDWDHLRELADVIEEKHGSFELLGVKQVDRMGSLLGNGRFKQAVGQKLTPEQLEALEAAYRAGYFQVPQAANAADVADRLGISQSTYSERIRHAVDALLNVMFSEPTDGG